MLCVGEWSTHNLVKAKDVHSVSEMKDEEGNDKREMDDGWDVITLDKA